MSVIYFKDHRRIGFEILENEYSFGDFLVTNEEEKDNEYIYRRITFIHKVDLKDPEIERCFLNIVENKYTYEECGGKCCKSDVDGSITPERSFFSQPFQDFCDKEEDLLEQTIINFFDNALWIYKSSSLFLHDSGYHWIWFSFNQKDWYLVPVRPLGSMITRSYGQKEYERIENEVAVRNKQLAQHLVESMNKGQTAPIYARIYFEAVGNLSDNPQTAIVLAVESVEVAVKTFVTHFDAKARWLIENTPSPPVEKILKEYVPILMPQGSPSIPKELINQALHKAISARNKIVHSGLYKSDKDETEKWVTDLGKILSYLEYYMGYGWAENFFERPFNHWFFK